MIEHSDFILPIDNQSLLTIANRISQQSSLKASLTDQTTSKAKAFDTMNNIVANLILNLTSSMRFDGTFNVDLNDLATNLVPFPRLKNIVSSMTPLFTSDSTKSQESTIDALFTEAFKKDACLVSVDPKRYTYLACALIVRGKGIEVSDMRRNIEK